MARRLSEILDVLAELAPLAHAEDWDNPGLLVEPRDTLEISRVLLTIDLTEAVLREAQSLSVPLVVAYHPVIFRALRRLTRETATERVVIDCLRSGIGVYSPHTALDAASGGISDWLAAALGPGRVTPIVAGPGAPPGFGMGRRVELAEPLTLDQALGRIRTHLGIAVLRVATTSAPDAPDRVATFAVCPGAGGSVFERLEFVDLLLTGEMRHHDILARNAAGTTVVLTDHTHSERGYLPILAERIRTKLDGLSVLVSEMDRDPLRVV